jgi:integrase
MRRSEVRILLSAPYYYDSLVRAWGFLIALYTGARAEEIFSLSVESIKTEDGTLVVPIGEASQSPGGEILVYKFLNTRNFMAIWLLCYLYSTRL